jgi:hypothetical protein
MVCGIMLPVAKLPGLILIEKIITNGNMIRKMNPMIEI